MGRKAKASKKPSASTMVTTLTSSRLLELRYDRIDHYRCPDCNHQVSREEYYQKALKIIAEYQGHPENMKAIAKQALGDVASQNAPSEVPSQTQDAPQGQVSHQTNGHEEAAKADAFHKNR